MSALGLGAGRIGELAQDERAIDALLSGALERGITLLDTARGYGASEERIGRLLVAKRRDFVLSTKVGYGVEGVPDWTYACVQKGIDDALARLRTDWIDVAFLHSCGRDLLERGEVTRALEDAKRSGKVRATGYSGENDALAYAIDTDAFDVIQCSVNVVDQRSLVAEVPRAVARSLGVIAKRPLANFVFERHARPDAFDTGTYFDRFEALAIDACGLPYAELALRFSCFAAGVTTAIVGTSRLEHLDMLLAYIARGPLPDARVAAIRERFDALGRSWEGVV